MGLVAGNGAPLQLTPRLETVGYVRMRLGIDHRRVDFARRDDLRLGQATWSVAVLAFEHGRIEAAFRRVGDEAILQAVEHVAFVQRSLVKRGIFAGRNKT